MLFKYSILLLLFIVMSVCGFTSLRQPSPLVEETASGAKQVKMVAAVTINFDKDVKPIFQKHCNPCHFPGGKLYDRLPFDQPSTIISNEQGILRRIKEVDEVKMIKQFVEENNSEHSGKATE